MAEGYALLWMKRGFDVLPFSMKGVLSERTMSWKI